MTLKKTAMIVMAFLPVLITLIMILFFLPEQIPAHYNAAGEITRWGSKYEALTAPIILIVFMGAFYGAFMHCVRNGEKVRADVIFIGSMIVGVTFNALSYSSLYKSMVI